MATRERDDSFTLTLKSELLDLLYARAALAIISETIPASENPPQVAVDDRIVELRAADAWQRAWEVCLARLAAGQGPDPDQAPAWRTIPGSDRIDRPAMSSWIQATVQDLQQRCTATLGVSTRSPGFSVLLSRGLRGLVVLPLVAPWSRSLADDLVLVSIRNVEDPREFSLLR